MSSGPQASPPTVEERLRRFLPIRVVLDLNDGVVQGLVEHSFSMDMDPKRVRIFWSGKAYSILGEHDLDGEADAVENCKANGRIVVDPLGPDSPIEVDWSSWLAAVEGGGNKFYQRNAPFKAKATPPVWRSDRAE